MAREKSAMRTASPARAGSSVFASEPAPNRQQASPRERLPSQRPIAERQAPAAPTRQTTKPRPASQSQRGSAWPRSSSATPTRRPSSCGVATAAASTTTTAAAAAKPRRPTCPRRWSSVDSTFSSFIVGRRGTELEVGRLPVGPYDFFMKGAIAAGHPLTAEAGARVLEAGGGAVDACVAAALVSWVCESPLTGPGGGGFMLVHEAASGRTTVLDFFVTVPLRSASGSLLELPVDFDGDTQQLFRTGAAAVAVPGTALGLFEAHARWGRVPRAELCERAVSLAGEGFELTPMQGYLHQILDPLLRHSPEGDALYGNAGRAYRWGERFALPELAQTIEELAADGPTALYRGRLAQAIVAHVQAGGGALSLDDLAAYAVAGREPVHVSYRGHEFRSNPPPSSGGVLIAL